MTAKKLNFTAPKIASLGCELGRSQTIYWDGKTPSLGLRVTPGGSKAYIFEAWFAGKSLRITIGDINSWSLGEAQAEARRLKVLTDQGIDPREQAAKIKALAVSKRLQGIQALIVWNEYILERKSRWGDRHLADHIDMARTGGEKVTRGLKTGQSDSKEPGILHSLLSQPLSDISRDKVSQWLKGEVSKRPARARLALSALKAFMTWAGDQERYVALVDTSACDRLTRELPPKKARDDCLQKEQLSLWFSAIKSIKNPYISAYLQILLLTGARRNELAGMKWEDVDLTWNTAIIRDKVEGTRVIPITPYVGAVIGGLKKINEYVFASESALTGHITEPRIAHKAAIDATSIPHLTIHGLRRSFGTLAEWVECPAGISAQIMGHKPSAIAEKHYRKRPIDLLRQWHTKIEEFILKEAGVVWPSPHEISK